MPISRELNEAIADDRRVIPLEGVRNFRDLGGYRTETGLRVRWGKLYRSATLHRASQSDQRTLATLGIVAVLDLRSAEERALEPSNWPIAPAHLRQSPKQSVADVRRALRAHGESVEAVVRAMTHYYAQRPTLFLDEHREMFSLLCQGRIPLLIHCTAGKDRTGTACALLLAALGVPRSTIIADYRLTSQLLPPRSEPDPSLPFGEAPRQMELTALPPAARAAVGNADPRFITASLDAVDRVFGSIHGYLEDGLGLSRSDIDGLGHLLEHG